VRRLVIRSGPPVPARQATLVCPRRTSGPAQSATTSRGHSRSRAGEQCIGHHPGAPFDATTKHERSDVTDAQAPPDGRPAADAEDLRASWLRAERRAWKAIRRSTA
jgi:hypothetical protein